MRTNTLASIALLLACLMPRTSFGVVPDSAFTETQFVFSWDILASTQMAWAPDGSNRLFVTRQQGDVRIVKDGVVLPTPFATLSPIYTGGECGLLNIAFDPNFLTNKYVYFFVSVSNSEQQIIRYTVSGDVGTNKTTIVSGLPTKGGPHDGGALGFGPDGKIYWAIGDMGDYTGANTDLSSLASKVGRANADGTVPNDNPYFDGAGPNADRIWARGLRNPFTFTFQPTTGLLWVNDVGDAYEQIFIVRRGDHAGWRMYENNQPAGFITPVIKYRTNMVDTRALLPAGTGAVRAGGVATFATAGAHGFRKGEKITIGGVADGSFNGNVFIASVPDASTFTAAQPGPDAQSGGGTAVTLNQGGCVTGGAFYDATQFPAAYRGNLFYGDCVSDRVMRATIDPSTNDVTTVDIWATSNAGIDVTVGPDGALYYLGYGSNRIFRTAYKATSQGLVVSPATVWTAEGQSAVVSVSLQMAPTSDVSVAVARGAGDSDIDVTGGATLTFTPANWNRPQTVTITAAADGDSAEDTATLSVSSSGLTTESVSVRARDQNQGGATVALLLSTQSVSVTEGTTGTFTVALSSAPSSNVTVSAARSAGDSDVSVSAGATLTFTTANWATPQIVTVAAAEDADLTIDTATIEITSSGLATRTVTVTATDNDNSAPLITSAPVLTGVVGAPYTYDVEASGFPAATFALDSPIAGMTIAATTGVISWTPTAIGSFPVTVRAMNGVVPNATQTFTVTVSADGPPTCVLTLPTANQTVSGANAEFFGDGMDDVGTVRAEFSVDGTLRYTDTNTAGHYHYGGRHNAWDTTALTNGVHLVRMTVFDTGGRSCFREVSVTVMNSTSVTDGGVADAAVTDARPDAAVGDAGIADARSDLAAAVDSPVVTPPPTDGPRADLAVPTPDAGAPTGDVAGSSTDLAVRGDTGTPSGPLADAAESTDLAPPPLDARSPGLKVTDTGCACRTGGRTDGGPGAGLGVIALLLVGGVMRRRRNRRPGGPAAPAPARYADPNP